MANANVTPVTPVATAAPQSTAQAVQPAQAFTFLSHEAMPVADAHEAFRRWQAQHGAAACRGNQLAE